ncbi:electron transfer flavoprotein subunit alpha/FixB family protein [Solibacillus isronensis]|uniref:electron transfer flavoprotein subunit alpha/FixB family protein n=1 Tax=Solibacillus isronensis TaxID=412383 RepID=UPI00399FCDAC
MSKIIAVAELRDNGLRNVSFETISLAKQWDDESEVVAVVLGTADSKHGQAMIHAGADRAILVSNEQLHTPTAENFTQALMQVINEEQPTGIVFGHTSIGKDVAPRIVGRLNAALLSDVVSIEGQKQDAVFTRPIYAGKAFEKTQGKTETVLVTVRPNNIEVLQNDSSRQGDITVKEVELVDLKTVVKEVVRKVSSGVDLSEAKVIVSGGRGIKSADTFEMLRELAELLGGTVGASRGACDAGYCDYALQIGQTGKVVTPDLYIACGISGAIQHVAGMSNSKIIVAINKDPEANIFSIADYGIVGDLFEVIPLLIEELKQSLKAV